MWIPTFFKGIYILSNILRRLISLCDLQLSDLRNPKILKKIKKKKEEEAKGYIGLEMCK